MVSLQGYNWTQLTGSSGIQMDGVHAEYLNGKHHTWGGWTTGANTFSKQYESTNGVTWTQITNAPWTGRHTCAYTKVGNEVYMVNGDVFNYQNDGNYAVQSWKYDGTTWTQVSTNNGLGGYSGGSLLYLNGLFYYVCGQLNTSPNSTRNQVFVSNDNCQSFTYLSTTPFIEGFTVGNMCVYNGRMWKIGGTVYSSTLNQRTYSRRIWSSADGINWVHEGNMPGTMRGRHYSQLIVWDGLMWMIGGYHGFRGLNNIAECWVSDNGKDWVSMSVNWIGRHACTCWVAPDGLYMGFGSWDNGVLQDVWKLTKN